MTSTKLNTSSRALAWFSWVRIDEGQTLDPVAWPACRRMSIGALARLMPAVTWLRRLRRPRPHGSSSAARVCVMTRLAGIRQIFGNSYRGVRSILRVDDSHSTSLAQALRIGPLLISWPFAWHSHDGQDPWDTRTCARRARKHAYATESSRACGVRAFQGRNDARSVGRSRGESKCRFHACALILAAYLAGTAPFLSAAGVESSHHSQERTSAEAELNVHYHAHTYRTSVSRFYGANINSGLTLQPEPAQESSIRPCWLQSIMKTWILMVSAMVRGRSRVRLLGVEHLDKELGTLFQTLYRTLQ